MSFCVCYVHDIETVIKLAGCVKIQYLVHEYRHIARNVSVGAVCGFQCFCVVCMLQGQGPLRKSK